jgi:hypothetical protein
LKQIRNDPIITIRDHINKQVYKKKDLGLGIITSSGLEERFSKIFQMLKWTKIQSILKKRELVMTFKAFRVMAPEYLTQMFHVALNKTYCEIMIKSFTYQNLRQFF